MYTYVCTWVRARVTLCTIRQIDRRDSFWRYYWYFNTFVVLNQINFLPESLNSSWRVQIIKRYEELDKKNELFFFYDKLNEL